MNDDLKKYRVWLRSVPGITQYDGYVDVWADDEDGAPAKAKRELKRTSFPDRSDALWLVERVERVHA